MSRMGSRMQRRHPRVVGHVALRGTARFPLLKDAGHGDGQLPASVGSGALPAW